MREIKFRGREICSGIWRHGSLLVDGGKCYIIQSIQGTPVRWNVDPDSVGQYTGLIDRNGREIYEGDILDAMRGKFVIGWGKEHVGFEVLQPYQGRLLYLSELYTDMAVTDDTTEYETEEYEWDWSVIGNIHDNQELLNI